MHGIKLIKRSFLTAFLLFWVFNFPSLKFFELFFAEQNVVIYHDLTFDHVPSNKLFILYCKANFIKPLILDKSLVMLIRKPTFENSDLIAVLIDGEATIKRVKFVGNKVILIHENNDYD